MNIRCLKCKGADLACGRSFCPIVARTEAMFKVKDSLPNQDFYGSAPAPFVGRFGYPKLNVGILAPPETREDAWEFDAPSHWAERNYDIPRIVDFRSSLINSRFKAYVKDKSKMLEISQEVGMASKPVDIEINLRQKPSFRVQTDSYTAPIGPNGILEKAQITSNPKVHTKVDKAVSDTDLKSTPAIIDLHRHGFDENFLSELLSVGTLGIGKNRKLVPTRWSITAVDDSLGRNIHKEITQYNEIDYCAYFGGYLGNYFLVLFFPDVWSYELFETYLPKSSWNVTDEIGFTTDHEFFSGRKTYAENCGGGYYASRLPVLQKLQNLRRQGTVLALRFITGEYAVPLGVWVVREAVRKALKSKPIFFDEKELMLKYARALVKKKFGIDPEFLLKESKLLKNMKHQIKLTKYFVK